MTAYQELMAGVSETRNLLKAELMNALNEGEILDLFKKSGI
ncbi:hypothetical protein MC7420_5262 [Coleofasciculus chthonoplastes PCC 7420]|uniref:Uncharacterized protein n=1 Tax=Coleofasciculus chthonoplastes PCC 7420 TaxID=118168 RepID=B4W2K8_9CYAN|nr:hypothetical protein MC7420_5262 [Coleofasciculus chthonoplastes PCC 7420]